jgi:hypothetical protein
MKRGSLILLVFFVGCDANFQSGKTQCSDQGECPSGYTCSGVVCVAVSGAGGGGGMGAAGRTGGPGGIGGSFGGAGGSSATSIPGCPTPEAGGTCNVFPTSCGCPTGQVCSPDIESIGLSCTADSKLGDGADCSSAQVCASGFGCFGDMCSKYCEYYSDCPMVDTAQSCLQTYWSNGDAISGVSVCARVCDPVSPQNPRGSLLACPAGFGCDTKDFWGASDCDERTGTGLTNSDCYYDADCMPGYFCDTSNGYFCTKYCFIDDLISGCPLGTTCTSFSGSDAPYFAGTARVGYCY